jgi:uncharacterized membrane protein
VIGAIGTSSGTRLGSTVCMILQLGLLLAAACVLVGSVSYLAAHGAEYPRLRVFASQPAGERLAGRIIGGVLEFRSASAIQFGAVCLIAAQVSRVASTLVGSSIKGNRRQMLIVATLLAVLLSAFLSAASGGA